MTSSTPSGTGQPSGSASDSGNPSGTGVPSGSGGSSSSGTGQPSGSASGSGNPSGTGQPSGSASGSGNPSGSGAPTGSGDPSGSGTGATGGGNGTSPTSTGSGGASGSGSGVSTTGTFTFLPTGTESSVPGITSLPDGARIILAVTAAAPPQKRHIWNMRRQSNTGGFIAGAGPSNSDSCDEADLFGVTDGQLLNGGEPIAVDAGVDYIPFKVNPEADISTTFSIVNGLLHWYNDEFSGGEAGFCQTPDGNVYITFAPNAGPADCAIVNVVTYYAQQCVDGQIVPVASLTSVPTPTATGPAGGNGGGPGSAETGVPHEKFIYVEGQAPDDVPCYETTLSYRSGEPTFLPHNEL
ncbi:hypothetical protein F5Y18DRAFT_393011 [Xylariaceae sp. FL1019]|nr:hypothetical protein F5Y18DRAFT_393011 [Xylariaceae sp. FL1019]